MSASVKDSAALHRSSIGFKTAVEFFAEIHYILVINSLLFVATIGGKMPPCFIFTLTFSQKSVILQP
jgi:hypothetical protein